MKAGEVVLYKKQIARVVGFEGDKVLIEFTVRDKKSTTVATAKVREKDIALLCAFTAPSLESIEKAAISEGAKSEVASAYELFLGEGAREVDFLDFLDTVGVTSAEGAIALFKFAIGDERFFLSEAALKAGVVKLVLRTAEEVNALQAKAYEKAHEAELFEALIKRLNAKLRSSKAKAEQGVAKAKSTDGAQTQEPSNEKDANGNQTPAVAEQMQGSTKSQGARDVQNTTQTQGVGSNEAQKAIKSQDKGSAQNEATKTQNTTQMQGAQGAGEVAEFSCENFCKECNPDAPLTAADLKSLQEVELVALGKAEKSPILSALHIKITPESAHSILLKLGAWPITRNPHIARGNLSMTSANIELGSPPCEERKKLTHTALAIDAAWSDDPDDALYFDGEALWVHIADPASAVFPDDKIDRMARERGATIYTPEGCSRMLCESALSDYALGIKPPLPDGTLALDNVLTFKITFSEDATIKTCEVFKSLVRVKRITYEEAARYTPPDWSEESAEDKKAAKTANEESGESLGKAKEGEEVAKVSGENSDAGEKVPIATNKESGEHLGGAKEGEGVAKAGGEASDAGEKASVATNKESGEHLGGAKEGEEVAKSGGEASDAGEKELVATNKESGEHLGSAKEGEEVAKSSGEAGREGEKIGAGASLTAEDEENLRALFEVAKKNKARRALSGSCDIDLGDAHITVDEDKRVAITLQKRLPSQSLVQEAMLLACEGAAIFAHENRIPFPFISQDSPPNIQKSLSGWAGTFQKLRSMKKRNVSVTPAMHSGLGLAFYSQVTSPLRRYLDLIAHEQLRAFLAGRPLIQKDDMFARITQSDVAVIAIKKAQRQTELHWKLIFLLQNPQWTGSAVCVDNDFGEWVLYIPSLCMQIRLRGVKLSLNDEVQVRCVGVDIANLKADFVIIEG